MARSLPTVSLLLSGDKCIAALAAIVLSLSSPASQAQSLPLVDGGKLTWGLAATFPPFQSMDNDKAVGFDVAMVDPITAKTKLTPR